MDMKKVGKLIAEKRKQLGYTQQAFGELLGVAEETVSKWEEGTSCPDGVMLHRIAVELKISMGNLLDGRLPAEDAGCQPPDLNAPVPVPELERAVSIDWNKADDFGTVSPYWYGNNLEHTRSSIYHGLSAQMLRNRKFAGKPSVMEGVANQWFRIGEKTFAALKYNEFAYTHHDVEHYHMHRNVELNAQELLCCEAGQESGMGQHEIYVAAGEKYDFAIVAKSLQGVTLTVKLTDRSGKIVYASTRIAVEAGKEWNRYTAVLCPDTTDADADLRIVFEEYAYITIGAVSLMNQNNFRGMRVDVIEKMKEIGIKVLRWPGGNFAGEYNWFDGLLPVDERAPFESYLNLETQPHSLGYDYHEINTDDFIALCREIGAEPFITINPAWNTAEENAAWVEYCNGDATTKYGKLRIERGFEEPYNVMLWSLGNEFGYGHMEGDNTPAGYSHIARECAKKMLEVCPNLTLCSSGPYPNEEWVNYSAKPLADVAEYVSLHYYATKPEYYDLTKLKSEYEELLTHVQRARNLILNQRALLGKGLKISFDEWNVWYNWYRPSCISDGIFAAMMFHMFFDEAVKSDVGIICQFEAVNEGSIQVKPYGAKLTAFGQMQALMKVHCGGTLRYVDTFTAISEKDGVTTMTVINASADHSKTVGYPMEGNCFANEVYVGKSLLPHHWFEKEVLPINDKDSQHEFELPPLSVAMVQYRNE